MHPMLRAIFYDNSGTAIDEMSFMFDTEYFAWIARTTRKWARVKLYIYDVYGNVETTIG